ncbi:nucleolar complex protein 3 homolog isoform X2 [Palaemon carinicauda]|uniref:nucleolar complex protein 3 homolog isoform X2 n=1 Tax=Palaemon carinicauda TaxID=392227 RepID=UPI0035B68E04
MAKRGSKLAKKAKKKGVAHSKMKNIQNLKRIKNKEFTPAERKARKEARREKKKMTYAELRARKLKELQRKLEFENESELHPLSKEVTGEDMLAMIDPEELKYLIEQNKDVDTGEEQKDIDNDMEEEQKDIDNDMEGDQKDIDNDMEENQKDIDIDMEEEEKSQIDEEKPYELEERSFHPMGNDMKSLLPFKTKTGLIQRYTKRDDKEPASKEKGRKKEIPEEMEEIEEEITPEEENNNVTEAKKGPVKKSVVELMAERLLKLERKKVAIGCLAVNFLEVPQDRLHCLSNLIHILEENDPSITYTVRKYAVISLLEVFHKTLPSYHYEPHDLTQKLKKETKEQYLYENFLLKSYQTFLKELERFLKEYADNKKKTPPAKKLALVSLKTMGELLIKHNYFAYTNNIIAALVPYLNSKDDEMCSMIVNYFHTLFKADIKGDVSLEAVKRIDHYIRKRTFHVREEMMSVLLSLRIKNVKSLDEELEGKNIAKKKLTHTEKLMRKLMEERKPKKSNKEAKKFRKFRKLEEQRKEHKMKRDEEVRSAQHTQIVEIVFGLYFHILKRRPNNKLNGIVLEGLAKFSHLVNVEFFSDLLNVLGGLMEEGTLKFRESLHCIQTVFTILSDQGEVLTLDPRRFYSYLYANMFKLSGGDNQDDIKSVLQSLMQMVVIRGRRVTLVRVIAFIKRLVTLSLNLLHNGALASLATARYIFLAHPSSEALLEIDEEGSCGVYLPEVEEPEHCNASSASLWELHLLTHHYHGNVRQFANHIIAGSPLQGDGKLPPNLGKRRVEDLYDDFDPATMRFNPAVPSPPQFSEGKHNPKRQKFDQYSTAFMTQEVQSILKKDEDPFDVSINEPKAENQNLNMKKNNRGVNYFSGLLPNMNLSKIKTDLPECEDEDVTDSLVNVVTKI